MRQRRRETVCALVDSAVSGSEDGVYSMDGWTAIVPRRVIMRVCGRPLLPLSAGQAHLGTLLLLGGAGSEGRESQRVWRAEEGGRGEGQGRGERTAGESGGSACSPGRRH